MVKLYNIVESRVMESGGEKENIAVYINPDEQERKYLIDHYQIDEHTLQSALDPDELSRIEIESNHVAIILKVPVNYQAEHSFEFLVSSMGMFLFDDVLIMVMAEDLPVFDSKTFSKVNRLAEIMIKIVNYTIFRFLEHLRVIDMVSDELGEKISTSMENTYLLNLFALEKSLVYYQNAINSNSVLIEKMKIYTQRIGFTVEDTELLDDITIENTQCYKQAEIYSNILASMMDARVSIVNNNLNILMKKLTMITIAIMVPTFVVSAFSMNVAIPIQKHTHAFWIIMAIAFVAMLGFFFFWRMRK
ncbi:MAG TPA: magnesium transporter CorA family protein [Syntrophorhabdaceae bacterium]|nr:magnesium transporter CorA family protein [Syntrophorhabdaceae bacterium]